MRNINRRKLVVALIFLMELTHLEAQTEILKDNGSWFTFSSKISVSNKLYVLNVIQQRRVGFLSNTQGFLFAPSINYYLNKNVSIGAGYLHYTYFTNGISHSPIKKEENRFFQHISIGSTIGKVIMNQRFRFEERVIDLINTNISPNIIDGTKYVNRFRYRIHATINLFKLKNNKHLLGRLSNEIRIRFSNGIKAPDFDQNNFAALVGYKLLNNSSIWIGYGNYYFKKSSTNYVSNTILHVSLSYNFDIRKK